VTEGAAGGPPDRPPLAAAGLAAGLLLLDVLLNVPLLSPRAPLASLLAPSIDFLVLTACCMGIARAGASAQQGLRIGFAVVAAAFLAGEAGLRFGWDAGGHLFGSGAGTGTTASWAISAVLLVAAGIAAFALSRLTVRGLQPPLARGVLLLAISLAAMVQVVSGRRLFAASIVPRLIARIL